MELTHFFIVLGAFSIVLLLNVWSIYHLNKKAREDEEFNKWYEEFNRMNRDQWGY